MRSESKWYKIHVFGSEKGWSEKLKEKASALVEDGIIPMLTDLSFTEEDLLLLKQRIENAKM